VQETGALTPDYYQRMYEVESTHWWHRGMREVSIALLGARWSRPGQRLLDAGCGTGGFLRFAIDSGSFAAACGIDMSEAAIELARKRVPDAELHVAPLRELPFDGSSFDLVTLNDVLQHVHEHEVPQGLAEVRRVLRPGGAVLVRTGGARRARSERPDWRVYDPRSLVTVLGVAGLRCERVTYANALPSAWAELRGRRPRAPTERRDGIPAPDSRLTSSVGSRLLSAEARLFERSSRSLPFGHTLLALATRPSRDGRPG
jgi:SAM-dependent methyltransferase